MKASVIIRTKNSQDIILQTLKALYSQTFKDFELVIVDSGSKDKTLSLIEKYNHKLIKVAPEDYHPGVVLNNAIKTCNSEIIVFLNSDTVMLTKNCLENLINHLELNDGAFARQISRPEAKLWVKRDYLTAFPTKEAPVWMHFSLPLAAIKKSAWNTLPFYTKAWASEDTKWGYEAKKIGLKVVYANDALVMHSHNYTLKQIFNRKFVEGEADVFIFSSKVSFFSCVKSYLKALINDVDFAIKNKTFRAIFPSFIIRAVYFYGYYLGHKFGEKRLAKNSIDTIFGNYQ